MRTTVGVISRVVMPLAVVMALAGCVGANPIPTLPPSPTTTPVFASEDEALAAAEDAYRAYSEMSDLVTSEGGADPQRLAPFLTEDQLKNEIETAEFFSSRGWRAVGSPMTVKFDLQQYLEMGGVAEIVTYVCIDVSQVRVMDEAGTDVTPPDRQPVVPLEVEFVGDSSDSLLISRSEVWSGSSFC